jgi:hypothetical protein
MRVIRYGIKPGKQISQRWFCYNCRRLSYTPLLEELGEGLEKEEASSNIRGMKIVVVC